MLHHRAKLVRTIHETPNPYTEPCYLWRILCGLRRQGSCAAQRSTDCFVERGAQLGSLVGDAQSEQDSLQGKGAKKDLHWVCTWFHE